MQNLQFIPQGDVVHFRKESSQWYSADNRGEEIRVWVKCDHAKREIYIGGGHNEGCRTLPLKEYESSNMTMAEFVSDRATKMVAKQRRDNLRYEQRAA